MGYMGILLNIPKTICNPKSHASRPINLEPLQKKWKLPLYIGVYIGIMEKKMETTSIYWGLYGDNGKENGNYDYILGFI